MVADTSDRLSLIERRWREAGCGDGDVAWLLEEVKRLRRHREWALRKARLYHDCSEHFTDRLAAKMKYGEDAARGILDEALNSGRGEYKP